MVAVMPCTAKKYEAAREEFRSEYGQEVDIVITTQELANMIIEMGISFVDLDQESFDMPYGFKTGGGVIFGNSGGVTEAVVRFAGEKLTGKKSEDYVVNEVRGDEGIREVEYTIGDTTLKIAIVSGLGNAKKVMEAIKAGEAEYDFVEMMACPGGCINGGGQPYSKDAKYREKRTKGLYNNDKMLQLHNSQDNPYITELYTKVLKAPNSHEAHKLLHTSYQPRKRMMDDGMTLGGSTSKEALTVSICFGTSCFMKGAQDILKGITDYMEAHELQDKLDIKATFCYEECDKGPVIKVGENLLTFCTLEKVIKEIEKQLALV
jgi:NADH-quinone oxidoreductase subunit G